MKRGIMGVLILIINISIIASTPNLITNFSSNHLESNFLDWEFAESSHAGPFIITPTPTQRTSGYTTTSTSDGRIFRVFYRLADGATDPVIPNKPYVSQLEVSTQLVSSNPEVRLEYSASHIGYSRNPEYATKILTSASNTDETMDFAVEGRTRNHGDNKYYNVVYSNHKYRVVVDPGVADGEYQVNEIITMRETPIGGGASSTTTKTISRTIKITDAPNISFNLNQIRFPPQAKGTAISESITGELDISVGAGTNVNLSTRFSSGANYVLRNEFDTYETLGINVFDVTGGGEIDIESGSSGNIPGDASNTVTRDIRIDVSSDGANVDQVGRYRGGLTIVVNYQ